jgi:hypothetical protein
LVEQPIFFYFNSEGFFMRKEFRKAVFEMQNAFLAYGMLEGVKREVSDSGYQGCQNPLNGLDFGFAHLPAFGGRNALRILFEHTAYNPSGCTQARPLAESRRKLSGKHRVDPAAFVPARPVAPGRRRLRGSPLVGFKPSNACKPLIARPF